MPGMNRPVPAGGLRPQDLPRPPEAALRILGACADPDSDLGAIADIVATDPALTAELLRVANSAYFGLGREVASIGLAVSLLGLDALRSRVLCIAVRAAADRANPRNLVLAEFMEDSVRRAVVARELALLVGLDADEAFAAGLLQDFGLLVLFHLHPQVPVEQWRAMRTAAPEARLELEAAQFGTTHDTVIADLAASWQLPAALAEAILGHHGESEHGGLPAALGAADAVCALFASPDPAGTLAATERVLERTCGLAGEACHALLGALPEQVADAAAGLGVAVGPGPDLDALTRDVNARLADDNLGYQELTWELQQAIRERDALAAEKQRELDIAREIQLSLLPDPSVACPVSAINASARDLSGDFYDYFRRADGRWCFALGDVSGKGVTAALLMAKTCSLFRCLGKRLDAPEAIVEILNDELAATSVRGMFVTLVAGVLDTETGTVTFVNAGHPPPLHVDRSGHAVTVPGASTPLGVVEGMSFETCTVSLAGGALYLYSDGVTEARSADGAELGTEGLADRLRVHAALESQARLDAVVAELLATPCERRDDVTIAVLEI